MKIISVLYKKCIPMSKYPNYLRKKGIRIGKNCEIYKNVSFGSEPYLIKIGNQVRINSGVQLVTHDGGCWVLRNATSLYGEQFKNADYFGTIEIEDNVHIGTNAIIMPGVHIGKNVVIGCGAIVTRNIPDNSIAVGIPAKVIESLDDYAKKMELKSVLTKNMSYEEKKRFLFKKFKIK